MANMTGGSVTWNLDVVDKGFSTGIAKAATEAKGLGATLSKTNFRQFAQNASTSFNSVANGIASATKKIALFAAAGSFGIASFVKSAADLQTTSKSFEVLIGNAEVANKLFAQIKRFADTTPFQFPELADSARVMLGFGVGVKDVFSRLKVLGDISAVTGADLKSLAVVFGQVTGAGRLMGQDALQLVNNNIPITTILTKRLGITAAELRKRIEQGAISAEVFTDALTGITKKGGLAFRGTDELAKTFNGRMSTLKDTVAEFGRNLLGVKVDPKLGFTIKPGGVFDILSKAIPRITASLTELAPKIVTFVELIVRNGPTIVALISAIAAAFVAAKLAAIGFFIVANIANPFFWIAVVIAGLVFLYVRFKLVRNIINSIFNFVKKSWPLLFAVLTGPIKLAVLIIIRSFGAIKDAAVGAFKFIKSLPGKILGAFSDAKDVLFDVGKDLIQGLIDGAGSLLKSIGSFFLDKVPKWIKGPFKKALGIESPSKVFAGFGQNIGEGLIQGISSSERAVKASLGGLTNSLGVDSSFSVTPNVGSVGALGGSSNTSNVTVSLNMDGVMARSRGDLRDIAKDMLQAVNEELRAKGVAELGGGKL